MKFNKCVRCGSFFVNSNSVCPNCATKDQNEISNLKNFLNENEIPNSVQELASNTGISEKNLNRYLLQDDLKFISKGFSL